MQYQPMLFTANLLQPLLKQPSTRKKTALLQTNHHAMGFAWVDSKTVKPLLLPGDQKHSKHSAEVFFTVHPCNTLHCTTNTEKCCAT